MAGDDTQARVVRPHLDPAATARAADKCMCYAVQRRTAAQAHQQWRQMQQPVATTGLAPGCQLGAPTGQVVQGNLIGICLIPCHAEQKMNISICCQYGRSPQGLNGGFLRLNIVMRGAVDRVARGRHRGPQTES